MSLWLALGIGQAKDHGLRLALLILGWADLGADRLMRAVWSGLDAVAQVRPGSGAE